MFQCNDAAQEYEGFSIFQNMRVPADSVISKVFFNNEFYAEAIEDLSLWESKGKHRPAFRVRVEAKRTNDTVDALIVLNE